MGSLSLRIPDSIHQKVREIAKKERVSINQFISSALSEKLSAFMTEEYLHKRAKRGSRNRFLRALAQVPDVEPERNDGFDEQPRKNSQGFESLTEEGRQARKK